jgi:predicted phosphodiesterase
MKVRILHISDPHGEKRTMQRLDDLARHTECDVIALTGDDVVHKSRKVPSEWDTWPQAHKLSVPGNHDGNDTFVHLTTWLHKVPWPPHQVGDLLFVGLDELPKGGAEEILSSVHVTNSIRGLVVLSHYQPTVEGYPRLVAALAALAGRHSVLILHGHDHPEQNPGEWVPSELLGSLTVSRSHLCSSAKNEGWGHYISWENGVFHHQPVQDKRRG